MGSRLEDKKGEISKQKGGIFWIEKKGRQGIETKIDGFWKDREDRVFCNPSFNLLHDLNSSICNE